MDTSPKTSFEYEVIEFRTWKELRSYFFGISDSLRPTSTVFRGHSDASWLLNPTIERLRPEKIEPFFKPWYEHAEKLSIDDFKRAFPLFSYDGKVNLEPKTQIEWLSIMQHHGAATRLLDVTTSPFIASFFALSDVYNKAEKCCIWAFPLHEIDRINVKSLNIKIKDKYQDIYDYYKNLDIESKETPSIIAYNFPETPSVRPYNQKGGFLYSMSNNDSFENHLAKYSVKSHCAVKKLIFNKKNKHEIINALKDFSNMNISNANLFPGLDGYSRDILIQQYISNS